jgi:hypothetical protein
MHAMIQIPFQRVMHEEVLAGCGPPCAEPEARCRSMARRTSCSRCPESLDAEPSTPMPTFTFVSSSFLTGAMPVQQQCDPVMSMLGLALRRGMSQDSDDKAVPKAEAEAGAFSGARRIT